MAKRVPRYLRSPRAESRGIAGEELWWPAPGTAGVVVTEDAALRLPALLAAIVGLAQDVAVLPLNVYQRQADGGRRSAPEHPVEELLSRSPDGGETTPICWRAALVGHALQKGNGFAEIQRRGRGTPYALHLLDHKQTRPERRGGVLGYTLGDGRRIPAGDVLHLAGFGGDGLSGYSFPKLLNQGIAVGLASEGYAAEFYGNNAEPGGVIETPQKLNTQAIENLREGWDDRHRGPGRRHRPAVLGQGAKWQSTSTDPEKSQLVETRKFQANDVTRPWRVPPHKYGDFSQAHLANIEASNLDYLQTALMWWLETWEQQCNLKLFTRAEWAAGYYVEHNTAALLRGDTTGRFNAYGKALGDGWLNRDEVRRRENLNPIGKEGGGQKYLVSLAMGTLEAAGNAPPPAAAASRALRFNAHHGPDGKFSSTSGGGKGAAGKRIEKTVAFASSKGVNVDPSAADAIRASKGDNARNIPAVYHAPTKKIYINQDHPYWSDPASLMGPASKSGWMSSSSNSHVVVHEIGHAEHHKKLGDAGYQRIRQRQWTDAERSTIAGQVSQYGRTKPIELVAEVYAGRQAGHKYSKEIDALYDDLGGP